MREVSGNEIKRDGNESCCISYHAAVLNALVRDIDMCHAGLVSRCCKSLSSSRTPTIETELPTQLYLYICNPFTIKLGVGS
jgi:hypothetical protein